MQIGWSTLAFASGTVATTVVAVSVMSLNSQQVRDNAFHVCVAKDRVLRLVETNEPCPEGQERLRLQEADTPDVEPPKDTDAKKDEAKTAPPADAGKTTRAIDPSETGELQKMPTQPEAAELESMPSSPAVSTVKAPFQVVDAQGKPILRVDTIGKGRGLAVYAPDGEKVVAYVSADDNGDGVFRAQSQNQATTTVVGATGSKFAGLRVTENAKILVDVGRSDTGKSYAARIYEASGGLPKATLGITEGGNSLVAVGNGRRMSAAMVATGSHRGLIAILNSIGDAVATLSQNPHEKGQVTVNNGSTPVAALAARLDGKGQIEVNTATTNVVTLTEGSAGGMIQVADKGGKTMVEAGIDPKDGVGVVRAGPRSGPTLQVGPAILVSRIVGKP